MEYTYRDIVGTLAAVEDSHPDVYVSIDGSLDQDQTKPVNPNQPELVGVSLSQQPVTRKLRTAIRHLRARAGFWSRFRGLSMYICYGLARSLLSGLMPLPRGSFIAQFFIQSIVGVLLAPWRMAWVHIVISEPSSKRFYQRIPGFRTWTKIAPAAALSEILTAAAFCFPMAIASFAGWLEYKQLVDETSLAVIARYGLVTAVPTVLALLITIPANVIFVRVAASMLPEEDETIVAFDRSFGGKVEPQIVGGSGHIGLLDAWTTFDWASRVRFTKVVVKTIAIQAVLAILAAAVIFAEIIALAPKGLQQGDDSINVAGI